MPEDVADRHMSENSLSDRSTSAHFDRGIRIAVYAADTFHISKTRLIGLHATLPAISNQHGTGMVLHCQSLTSPTSVVS